MIQYPSDEEQRVPIPIHTQLAPPCTQVSWSLPVHVYPLQTFQPQTLKLDRNQRYKL